MEATRTDGLKLVITMAESKEAKPIDSKPFSRSILLQHDLQKSDLGVLSEPVVLRKARTQLQYDKVKTFALYNLLIF